MAANETTTRQIYRFNDIDWHVPTSEGIDPELAAEAGRQGTGRKFLAQGDGGFYSQIVRIPPNFDAPTHSHNHAEVFMVLEGSCLFDGEPMGPRDMTVVEADRPYAFVAGPEGLQFLIVRGGKANVAIIDTGKGA